MGAVLAAECERARAWASLGLDGELSQVEHALLRAHVGRCAACAGFASEVGALTQELRTTELERVVVEGVPARRRSSGVRTLQLGAAAAVIVIAAGLGTVAGSPSSREQGRQSASPQFTPQALRVAALSALRPLRLPGTRLQKPEAV
jgi:predicted anti-sigma-YlaC factor YlaD